MGLFDVLAGLAGGAGQGYLASQQVADENEKEAQAKKDQAAKDITTKLANAHADLINKQAMQDLVTKVAGTGAASATKTPGATPDASPTYGVSPDLLSKSGLPPELQPVAGSAAVNQRTATDQSSDLRDAAQELKQTQAKHANEIADLKARQAQELIGVRERSLASREAAANAKAGESSGPVIQSTDQATGETKQFRVGKDGVAHPVKMEGEGEGGAIPAKTSATVLDRQQFNKTVSDQAGRVLAGIQDPEIAAAMDPRTFAGSMTEAQRAHPFLANLAANSGVKQNISPKVRQFMTDLGSLKLTLSHAHYFKGSSGMVEHANQVIGAMDQPPENLAAAVRGFKNFMDLSNADRGAPNPSPEPIGGAPKVGDHKQYPNGKTATFDGHGWKAD